MCVSFLSSFFFAFLGKFNLKPVKNKAKLLRYPNFQSFNMEVFKFFTKNFFCFKCYSKKFQNLTYTLDLRM